MAIRYTESVVMESIVGLIPAMSIPAISDIPVLALRTFVSACHDSKWLELVQ